MTEPSLSAMFVRVKREKTTFFLHVEPGFTILELKQQIQRLTGQPVDRQRLLANEQVLEDPKTLAELKVENDMVLALVYGEFAT